jgi:hypothetical protein
MLTILRSGAALSSAWALWWFLRWRAGLRGRSTAGEARIETRDESNEDHHLAASGGGLTPPFSEPKGNDHTSER